MSWEWVAPTATAAVGLAGIAATWLTAQSGRTSQRDMMRIQHEQAIEDMLRETRRVAYVEFLTNLHSAIYIAPFDHIYEPRELVEIQHSLLRSLAEVRLVGTDLVIQMASQMTSQVMRYQAQNLDDNDSTNETRMAIRGALDLIERLMASDLGISVSGTREEMMRHVTTIKETIDLLEERKRGQQIVAESTAATMSEQPAVQEE